MINSLSIILPIYNEEKRLRDSLKEVRKFYLNKDIKNKEFIFVNDGSSDNTKEIVKNFISKNKKKLKNLHLINFACNLGKGAALKAGVLKSKKEFVLTSDVDFSVSLFQINKWQKNIRMKPNGKKFEENVYYGSRGNINSIVNSRFHRKIIGYFLGQIIYYSLGIDIKDTQCGFKLYPKSVAKKIFSKLKSSGFEHDIEITLLLKKYRVRISELPVTWTHKPYSKVNIISDSLKILKSIFLFKKIFKK